MMTYPIKTFEPFEVVAIPFPFTDSAKSKRRPALILSSPVGFSNKSGHTLCAMITSSENSPWPLDITITKQEQAGLPAPSVVRMKLFTIDNRFIIKSLGKLATKDTNAVQKNLRVLLKGVL